jgi:hypothetical protein
MKIPYPGDLNTIETAVWAAEYVRRRSLLNSPTSGAMPEEVIDSAIFSANHAVEDLRRASDRQFTDALYEQEPQ